MSKKVREKEVAQGCPTVWECSSGARRECKWCKEGAGAGSLDKLLAECADPALDEVQAHLAALRGPRDHPGFTRIPHLLALQFLRDGSSSLLVMAFTLATGGASIADLYKLSQRGLPEPAIAHVVSGLLDALSFLHSALNIIHRDVKAANVLLNEDGAVLLADLGIAALLPTPTSLRTSVIGTPLWMAPEVIDNTGIPTPYGRPVDIWGLGITVLEMAEAGPPLEDLPPLGAMLLIPTRPPPTLRPGARASPALVSFLSACLAKEPDDRPTASELRSHPFLSLSLSLSRSPSAAACRTLCAPLSRWLHHLSLSLCLSLSLSL